MQIKQLLKNAQVNTKVTVSGWVRTMRMSGSNLGFCNINDGSNVSGIQIVITDEQLNDSEIESFFYEIKTGCYIECKGILIKSPASGQEFELKLLEYELIGKIDESYPLCKSKMNLDTLRNFIHLRARTNTFGSVFRIRSSVMKILHDFYHDRGFLHLDPNIITMNECEGGAGVFQLTENDITDINALPKMQKITPSNVASQLGDTIEMIGNNIKTTASSLNNNNNSSDDLSDIVNCAANVFQNVSKRVNDNIVELNTYDWNKDHFNCPTFLTVSSQLQLEAMACALGNVYTTNKSFRSEHSCTSKHVSEFTHLEIEMVNNTLDDLMNISEDMIKYTINEIFKRNQEDLDNLSKFISKGLTERLTHLLNVKYKRIKYSNIVNEINDDIENKEINIPTLKYNDDLSSVHENYITEKYNCPVFVTHWPFKIKSFYMKQCDNGECESFDLLMPYGIGELIGASQREEIYEKLVNGMKDKNVELENMKFYTDLRLYGTCPHGGFGLGFDRLLMLITGMQNIKDVIPFPVFYKNCKF
jgi:asparaginyl-tRNA synthetase